MLKTKMKKVAALLLVAVMAVSLLAGCGGADEKEGKIVIKIAHWPDQNNTGYEEMEARRQAFMAENPDIYVEGDTYHWDAKNFNMLASSGQLANMVLVPFTEVSKIIAGGYAADITDTLSKMGYLDAYNPDLIELLSNEEGRVFGIPDFAYAQGLTLNTEIFKEAGLVNADGSPKVPSTYQELAEYAQIIREKTGKGGMVFPSTNNGGGWHFLNVAWAHGVEFLDKQDDGSYKAGFDTPEFKAALQYMYDLKWKYNAIQDNANANVEDVAKLIGTQQVGMGFYNPPGDALVKSYGMPKEYIYMARLPEGPAGRYAQLGGNVRFMSKETTPEQQEAVMKWWAYCGNGIEVTDAMKTKWEENAKQSYEEGNLVLGRSAFSLWVNPERTEAEKEVQAPYVNVDPKNFDDYFSFTDVIIRPEPEVCAQELYSVIDKGIQEIFTNKNVDLDALIDELVKDFQLNHLDKLR